MKRCRGCQKPLTKADKDEHGRRKKMHGEYGDIILVNPDLCLHCLTKATTERGLALTVATKYSGAMAATGEMPNSLES